MKKTILTSISLFALLLLASCSTDNIPTEASGSAYKSNNVTTKSTKQNQGDSSFGVAIDTAKTDIKILNSTSKTLENGDVGTLKDKKK